MTNTPLRRERGNRRTDREYGIGAKGHGRASFPGAASYHTTDLEFDGSARHRVDLAQAGVKSITIHGGASSTARTRRSPWRSRPSGRERPRLLARVRRMRTGADHDYAICGGTITFNAGTVPQPG